MPRSASTGRCGWWARRGGARRRPAVRGAARALPVTRGLAPLLAGADPIRARARDTVLELIERGDFIPRLVFFGALLAGALGAGGVTLREGAVPRLPRPIRSSSARVGGLERLIVLASVAGLFWPLPLPPPPHLHCGPPALLGRRTSHAAP